MALGIWVLRPSYLGVRLTLASGYTAPRAIAATGTSVFVAPSTGMAVVQKIDTSSSTFAVSATSAALSANVAAMALMSNLATPQIAVITNETPAKVYKLRQDTLAQVGTTLTLSTGEGPATRAVYDGTYLHVLIGASPGRLVAVDPSGVSNPLRSHALTLNSGENTPRGLTYDAPNLMVYVGASNGNVVKILNVPATPAYTRQTALTLPLTNASALAFGNGYLYAGAGGAGGTGHAAAYQINPTTMAVAASVGDPYVLDGWAFTDMRFDSGSLSPNRFVYASAYKASTSGELYQFTTGADGDGFTLSRRFGLDDNYILDADSQLAFVPTTSPLTPNYLYFSQYVDPGILVRFDTAAIGLILKPRAGWEYDRPTQEVLYKPVGANDLTIRTMGVSGRSGRMTHLIRNLSSEDAFYIRREEDEATICACRPFAYLRDPSPAAYAITRAVAISAPHMNWVQFKKGKAIELSWQMRAIR